MVKEEGNAGEIAGFFHKIESQRDTKDKGSHHKGKIQYIDKHVTDQ